MADYRFSMCQACYKEIKKLQDIMGITDLRETDRPAVIGMWKQCWYIVTLKPDKPICKYIRYLIEEELKKRTVMQWIQHGNIIHKTPSK
jgi:hypothetical protein